MMMTLKPEERNKINETSLQALHVVPSRTLQNIAVPQSLTGSSLH
ncbi:hypothetical protein PZ892_16560 [Sphingobacterium sp. WM]|nr:hypothetical protein [Sphingobacterium sp. WM]WFB63272.1 hypothetical protein PZ892_16560 [Sphingobacterium sp. WM]